MIYLSGYVTLKASRFPQKKARKFQNAWNVLKCMPENEWEINIYREKNANNFFKLSPNNE